MYPTFELLAVRFYTFGIIIACTWLLFFVLLHRFSLQKGILRPIFSDIFTFTLSIFFFSRIFHIMRDWLDEKFILIELFDGKIVEFLKLFFIPQNYLFSLFGAIVGFILIFTIKTHAMRKERGRYFDAIMLAFLFSCLLWYFGSLLGGQVYGISFSSPISITYNHIDTIVKDRAPLFPLAFFYIIIISGILFGIRRFSSKKILPDGLIGYISIGAFSLMIFLGEFLDGAREDIFYDFFSLSLNQLWALLGLIFAILWLLRLIQERI